MRAVPLSSFSKKGQAWRRSSKRSQSDGDRAGKFVDDELVDHAGSATERSLQQLGVPMDAPGHPYGTVRLADPGALSCRERSFGASGAAPGAVRR